MRLRRRDDPLQALPPDGADDPLEIAFAFGLANGERNTVRPKARIDSYRCLEKMSSREWIRYLRSSVPSTTTSLICCSVQAALGCAAMSTCARRRGAGSILSDAVTATRKSHVRIALA